MIHYTQTFFIYIILINCCCVIKVELFFKEILINVWSFWSYSCAITFFFSVPCSKVERLLLGTSKFILTTYLSKHTLHFYKINILTEHQAKAVTTNLQIILSNIKTKLHVKLWRWKSRRPIVHNVHLLILFNFSKLKS